MPALWKIALGNPPGGEACVAAGAVPAIVAALKSHCSVAGVKECALYALRNIADSSPAGKEACVAAGAVPAAVIAIINLPPGGTLSGKNLLTSLGYSECGTKMH